MKKYTLILLFSLYSVGLFSQNEKPSVVATASMWADMAKQIAGDYIDVKLVVPIGGDPHIYEPTPGDAIMVADADLILRNGLTFEGWLNELIENSGTKAPSVLITKGVDAIESSTYKNAADPHAWMDAQNGLIYIKNIRNAILTLIPQHAESINESYDSYKKQLIATDEYIKERVNEIPEEQRILITSHDAFQYFGRKYGIRLEAILGTSTDAEVQTSDINRVNNIIKESNLKAVFIESTINPKLLQQLAIENDIAIGGKLFSDSLGDEDSEAPTYIDMLRYNAETITGALTGKLNDHTHSQDKGSNLLMIVVLAAILIGALLFLAMKLKPKND